MCCKWTRFSIENRTYKHTDDIDTAKKRDRLYIVGAISYILTYCVRLKKGCKRFNFNFFFANMWCKYIRVSSENQTYKHTDDKDIAKRRERLVNKLFLGSATKQKIIATLIR